MLSLGIKDAEKAPQALAEASVIVLRYETVAEAARADRSNWNEGDGSMGKRVNTDAKALAPEHTTISQINSEENATGGTTQETCTTEMQGIERDGWKSTNIVRARVELSYANKTMAITREQSERKQDLR
jgi:hypothetical protein